MKDSEKQNKWLTPRGQQTQIIKDLLYASCASYMFMNETIRDKIIFLLLCDVIYDVVINRVATDTGCGIYLKKKIYILENNIVHSSLIS